VQTILDQFNAVDAQIDAILGAPSRAHFGGGQIGLAEATNSILQPFALSSAPSTTTHLCGV
jgi:hypothetical protein